jgi:hypothetical protein
MQLAMILLASSGWSILAALAALCFAGMALTHQGSWDLSAILDMIGSQCQATSGALTTGTVFPAGALTGSQDVVYVNTATTPGTITTRTAAQMIADLIQELGFTPPVGYTWFITIVSQGTSTLTLGAGTGVTLGSGTNSVAGPGNRTYYGQVTALGANPAITIQTTGSGSA